jgi:hypothetical protein
MTMRIYLGGASAERELIIADAQQLERAGHTITAPWWTRVHEARALGYASDADVPDEYTAESAEQHENGICDAEAVVFRASSIEPRRAFTAGAAYELAFAKLVSRWRDIQRKGVKRRLAYDDLFSMVAKTALAACAPLPILIYGDPKRFIGIWTKPQPVLCADLEQVIGYLVEHARRVA